MVGRLCGIRLAIGGGSAAVLRGENPWFRKDAMKSIYLKL